MTRMRMALLVALLALPAAAGCGGDDEQAEAVPDPPKLTVPRTNPEPDPPTTAPAPTTDPDAPAEQAPAPDHGEDPSTAPLAPGEGDGTSEPPTGGTPDGPANDSAPPAGSPAERFERECEADPASCG
jgi:hypothetical protein